MGKTLKSIIDKTIDTEYKKVLENLPSIMEKSPESLKDYRKYRDKKEEIMNKLLEVVPEEYRDLIDDFESIDNALMSIEAGITFKEGIVLGVNELSYLNEVEIEITLI